MTSKQLLAVLEAIIYAGSFSNPSDYHLRPIEAVEEALLIQKAAREKLK